MIQIKNKYITAEFDDITGDWIRLGYTGIGELSVLQRPGPAFAVRIDGKQLFSGTARQYALSAAGLEESREPLFIA